uniref:THAP-type domain-containing protein n=1 Tax=Nothobranchius furzeri TaxID=105023 RepID=A0A8C6PV82_NOTFU
MVDSCCAPGCANHRGQVQDRAFYRIPKDPARRERWISAIKRARSAMKKTERWNPSHNGFRLCSDHFSDNPLSPDYVPSVFKHVPSPVKKKGELLIEQFNRRQAAKKRRLQQDFTEAATQAAMGSYISAENDSHNTGPSCENENCKTIIYSLKLEVQALRAENQLLKESLSKTELNESALRSSFGRQRL